MRNYVTEPVRFVVRTEMIIGCEAGKKLPELLSGNGWKRVGLVVDKGLYDASPYARDVIESARAVLDDLVVLIAALPEPTYDYLDEMKVKFLGRSLDCFVGIGGGSTMDLAKGLATLQTNPGKAIEYRGFGKVKNVPLPVVALPSTAGTGSEITPYAVFIDTQARWKFGINSEYNYPRCALYDHRLLDTCPARVYASSGMDAMTHTLESFVAKSASVLSRMVSVQAFELLFANLKRIARGDRSPETKLNVLVGSGLAGMALMNAGAGPAGALSYPLGVYFEVPHGLAGSVFLPGVIQYNVEQGYTDYAHLYDIIHPGTVLSLKEKSLKFAEEIKILSDELGIPTSLGGFGAKTDADLQLIVDNALQLKAAFEQNPVPFGMVEIQKLIFSLR